jgi:hypothetical protein
LDNDPAKDAKEALSNARWLENRVQDAQAAFAFGTPVGEWLTQLGEGHLKKLAATVAETAESWTALAHDFEKYLPKKRERVRLKDGRINRVTDGELRA